MADNITREIDLEPTAVPALDESLLRISDSELEFLHEAVTKDDAELKRRILEVQKITYAEHPYPCIRAFHFVNLMMSNNPIYPEVVKAGQSGQTVFLDLGCCMGTDVRKLVLDGYPASNILGCDLRREFIDAGYKLFQDQPTCKVHFFTSDIFEVPSSLSSSPTPSDVNLENVTDLIQLQGKIDHFYAGALFHLFDEATQYAIAIRIAGVLLKRKEGSVVFGRHQGLFEEGMIADGIGRNRYGHSPKSWEALWKKVFAVVESEEFANEKVKVDAILDENWRKDLFKGMNRGVTCMLQWSVRII